MDTVAAAARFWAKVDRRGPEECWPWTASANAYHYGNFRFGGRIEKAHRIAFLFGNRRAITPGLCVLHKCDSPLCCNPAHLFLGTHGDNMRDRAAKGRAPKGFRYSRKFYPRKVTLETVRRVRDAVRLGVFHRVIAKREGLSRASVQRIIHGKDWAHVQ